ncbi:MAG: DUF975 domain-containing protein [Cyanobacteria bacterium J06621_8]
MKPLSVGNVVSAGLRIYRDNFKKYFKLAFIGYLWFYIPAFIVGIAIGFLGVTSIQGSSLTGLYTLLIILATAAFLYGAAKYFTYHALIARLAYSEIIEKPESIKEANRHVKGKMWSFLIAALLVFLRFILVYIGGAILIAISIGALTALLGFGLGSILGDTGAAIGAIISVLLSIALFIGFISYIIRLFASFSATELLLSTQNNLRASQALGKSQELTKGYLKNLIVIYVIASLVSIPIWGLVFILQIIPQLLQNSELASFSLALSIFQLVFNALTTALIIPFWQSIKAVIYYDLKVRREGMGLDLNKS